MRIIFFLFSVCEYEYTVLTTSPSVSLYWIRLMGWVVRINLLVISHIYTVCSSRTFLKSTSRYAMSPFILFFSPYVLFIIPKIGWWSMITLCRTSYTTSRSWKHLSLGTILLKNGVGIASKQYVTK